MVIDKNKAFITIDSDDNYTPHIRVVNRPHFTKNVEKAQNKIITTGYKSFKRNGVLLSKLNGEELQHIKKEIYKFMNKSPPDYHPNSDNKIIDIIHPSLYPYVNGKSKFKKTLNITSTNNMEFDYWNRPYEKSKYQWLPSEFVIDKNGNCTVDSYINNLPENEINLKKMIEQLFTTILPYFETIWNYINVIRLYNDEDMELFFLNSDKACEVSNDIKLSLKNRKLQVITKIVLIELENDKLDGAWHVEGMSHENIIATAVCVLEQSENLEADLFFKRRFTICEAVKITHSTGQDRPEYLNDYLGYSSNNSKILPGLVPLGKVSTESGSIMVFPNSHIHRLDISCKKKGKRLVIVFWLINPDIKVISTENIERQQNKSNFSMKEAIEIRLKLMKERTYYKKNFNVRDLNLCEH